MEYIKLVLFLGWLRLISGCGGGYYYYYPSEPETKPETEVKEEEEIDTESSLVKHAKKIISANFGGFEIPEDMIAALFEWLENVRDQQDLANLHNDSELFEKERGPGSGWPSSWGGIGSGLPGFPPDTPPLHAFVPTNEKGVPPHCFFAPQKGYCNYTIERWYYHPYLEQCLSFNYTGCGGNDNKYDTEFNCERSCMHAPGSGCDPDTGIYVEAYGILEDRRRMASNTSRRCQ